MRKNEFFATKDIKGNYITFDNRAEARDAGQFRHHRVVKVRVVEVGKEIKEKR